MNYMYMHLQEIHMIYTRASFTGVSGALSDLSNAGEGSISILVADPIVCGHTNQIISRRAKTSDLELRRCETHGGGGVNETADIAGV